MYDCTGDVSVINTLTGNKALFLEEDCKDLIFNFINGKSCC